MGAGHDHGHGTRTGAGRRYGDRGVPRAAAGRAVDHARRHGGRDRRRCGRRLARPGRRRGAHGDGRAGPRHGAAGHPLREPSAERAGAPSARPRRDPRRPRQLSAAARRRRVRPVRGDPAVHHAGRHRGRADHRVRRDRPGREHGVAVAADARAEGEPERARRVPGGGGGRARLGRGADLGGGDPAPRAGRPPTRSPRS